MNAKKKQTCSGSFRRLSERARGVHEQLQTSTACAPKWVNALPGRPDIAIDCDYEGELFRDDVQPRAYVHKRNSYPLSPKVAEWAEKNRGASLSDFAIGLLCYGLQGASSEGAGAMILALVQVVSEVLLAEANLPPREFSLTSDHACIGVVLALPAEIVSNTLAQKYLTRHWEAARASYERIEKVNGPIAAQKKRDEMLRTTNSLFSKATHVFLPCRCECYRQNRLSVSDELTRFAESTRIPVEKPAVAAIPFQTLERLMQDLSALSKEDPDVCLDVVLGLRSGLRAREASSARTSWLEDVSAVGAIHVQDEGDFSVKTGRSRKARVFQRRDFGWILKFTKGRKYLLGDSRRKRQAVRARTYKWLKEHGASAGRPFQFLRRLYASSVVELYGWKAAQQVLGHASPDTTAGSYWLKGFSPEMAECWSRSLNLCFLPQQSSFSFSNTRKNDARRRR